MRLPDATLIAQYPEDHVPVAEVRKESIPCILPHVVFINCRIFLASVEVDANGVPGFIAIGFLMGERGRDDGITIFCRSFRDCGSSGGEGMIDRYPIEEGSSSSSWRDGECSEPTRGRTFNSHGVGDFSLKRSSRVLVLGLE